MNFEFDNPIISALIEVILLTGLVFYSMIQDIHHMEKSRKYRFLRNFRQREMEREGFIFDEEGHIIGMEEQ